MSVPVKPYLSPLTAHQLVLRGEARGLVVNFNIRGVFGVSPAQIGKYDDPSDNNINQATDKISVQSAD